MNHVFQRPVLACLLVAGCLASLGACAPLVLGGAVMMGRVATDRRTAGAVVEDEGIELKAGARIRDALFERAHVNVTSFNRQVLLTGEVPSAQDKLTAEKVAQGVENVRGVMNEIDVMGNASFGQRSSDALVSARIKSALVDAQDLYANAFRFITERGTVYLMGRANAREIERATDIIRGTAGVTRVVRILEAVSEEELQGLQPPPADGKK